MLHVAPYPTSRGRYLDLLHLVLLVPTRLAGWGLVHGPLRLYLYRLRRRRRRRRRVRDGHCCYMVTYGHLLATVISYG